MLPFNHVAAAPRDRTPEEEEALREWGTQRLSSDIELYIRAMSEYQGPDGWVQAQRHGGYMTREELLGFYGEYLALLRKYSHDSQADAQEGAREMALRFVAVPRPGQQQPGQQQQQQPG